MNKIVIDKLDDVIHHEVLENGLEVYLYKKPGFIKKSVSLIAKYGSIDDEFMFEGDGKTYKYPKGIAHFLEHKLFESEDNEQVFKKFANYGASVNAYTSSSETCYYFSCNDNFYDCLNLLMDFVWSPYITDENVEKEKGIIKREISMTDDNLYRFIYNKSMENILVSNHHRYNVIGTCESVDSITKEQLMECYEAFYHPSNMFLTIAGDIDIQKTISEIKEFFVNKNIKDGKKIIRKQYSESKKVFKKYEEVTRNVVNPRMIINYKFVFSPINEKNGLARTYLFNQILNNSFGSISDVENDLVKKKIIKSAFSSSRLIFDDVAILSFSADVINKEKFESYIEDRLHNPIIDEKTYNLHKKAYIASLIRAYDDPEEVVNIIQANIIKYGAFIKDAYKIISNYSFDDYKNNYNKLDFSNKSVIYIKGK